MIKNSVRMHTSGPPEIKHDQKIIAKLKSAAEETISLLRSQLLPKYDPRGTCSQQICTDTDTDEVLVVHDDCNYSFSASFSGFVFSMIDKFPSEVAVITLRKIDAMAEWNAHRSKEAAGALSIEWMQIDNHCPNAPFPVALYPVKNKDDVDEYYNEVERPFLSIAVVLAPHHKSNIIVSILWKKLTDILRRLL